MREKDIVVMKIDASVLPDSEFYFSIANFLRKTLSAAPDERWVVALSAEDHRERTDRVAQEIQAAPDPRTVDLLRASGELRLVALLTLHLGALGVLATGLNVHETGVRWDPADSCAGMVVDSAGLEGALERHPVVVVPAFFATNPEGMMASLGRGGSDLLTVALAVALNAKRWERLEDFPGCFLADRRGKNANRDAFLSYEMAMEMGSAGCPVVHQEALGAAAHAGLPLVIRGPDGDTPRLIVGREDDRENTCLVLR